MKKRTQPAKDLYQQITDQILEALEQGKNLGIVDGHKWLFHATVKVVVNTPGSMYFCFG